MPSGLGQARFTRRRFALNVRTMKVPSRVGRGAPLASIG